MSPNGGPVGYVDPAGVRYVAPPAAPRHGKPYALPADCSLLRVDIVYSHIRGGFPPPARAGRICIQHEALLRRCVASRIIDNAAARQ